MAFQDKDPYTRRSAEGEYQPPRRIGKSSIARIKAALQDKEMIDFDRDSIYQGILLVAINRRKALQF